MRKLMILIALLVATTTFGQVNTKQVQIKNISSTCIQINGQDYPKSGFLLTQYKYGTNDSTLGLLYANTRTYMLAPTIDSLFYYVDSSKKAYNMTVLRTWFRTNLGN